MRILEFFSVQIEALDQSWRRQRSAKRYYPDTLKSWKSNPLCEKREMQNALHQFQLCHEKESFALKLTFHAKKLVIKKWPFCNFFFSSIEKKAKYHFKVKQEAKEVPQKQEMQQPNSDFDTPTW